MHRLGWRAPFASCWAADAVEWPEQAAPARSGTDGWGFARQQRFLLHMPGIQLVLLSGQCCKVGGAMHCPMVCDLRVRRARRVGRDGRRPAAATPNRAQHIEHRRASMQ